MYWYIAFASISKSFNFLPVIVLRWIGLFLLQVFFLPLSNTIITGFKDDTIFGWESDTLNCKYQLPVPPGKSPHYKAYAPTRWSTIFIQFSCMLLLNIATTFSKNKTWIIYFRRFLYHLNWDVLFFYYNFVLKSFCTFLGMADC